MNTADRIRIAPIPFEDLNDETRELLKNAPTLPALPRGAKLYIASRDTRWDVYPQREPAELIAHGWEGFFAVAPAGDRWFRTPTSYNFQREIAASEIEAVAL